MKLPSNTSTKHGPLVFMSFHMWAISLNDHSLPMYDKMAGQNNHIKGIKMEHIELESAGQLANNIRYLGWDICSIWYSFRHLS